MVTNFRREIGRNWRHAFRLGTRIPQRMVGWKSGYARCKYDLVVYDNVYIINKHFSKKNRNFIFRNTYEH